MERVPVNQNDFQPIQRGEADSQKGNSNLARGKALLSSKNKAKPKHTQNRSSNRPISRQWLPKLTTLKPFKHLLYKVIDLGCEWGMWVGSVQHPTLQSSHGRQNNLCESVLFHPVGPRNWIRSLGFAASHLTSQPTFKDNFTRTVLILFEFRCFWLFYLQISMHINIKRYFYHSRTNSAIYGHTDEPLRARGHCSKI